MKPFLLATRLFVLGFALILISNAIALLGVASNRSGKPEAVIELTERELTLPYRPNDENSGLALNLSWRIVQDDMDPFYSHYGHWGSTVWFDAEKLTELGFIIDKTTCSEETSKRKEPLPKDAFIVFEYDGASYQIALQRAEKNQKKAEDALKANDKDKDLQDRLKEAHKHLEAERNSASRLFAIDVGLDAVELRQRYPGRSKFVIMQGIVNIECRSGKTVVGRIVDVRIDKINVPLSYRKLFDSILTQDRPIMEGPQKPRYKVEVAYGNRFEPWIQRVDNLNK